MFLLYLLEHTALPTLNRKGPRAPYFASSDPDGAEGNMEARSSGTGKVGFLNSRMSSSLLWMTVSHLSESPPSVKI